jgi:hypothetical protein
MLNFELAKIAEYWRLFASGFNFRRHAGPLDTFEKIEDFAISRSAYIAQRSLYGYVKTRMGTRYPDMFKDDNIIRSLNIAKMHVYAACLSDLTIWTVATAFTRIEMPDSVRMSLAERIFKNGLEQNLDPSVSEFSIAEAVDAFARRVHSVDWRGNARTRDVFTASPAGVIKWAPIADSLKKYDVESVENSVKFSWNNIREQFNKRLNAEAITEQGRPGAENSLAGDMLPG